MKATLHCPPPPMDGTAFLAEARVIIEDSLGCSITPVVGRMRFAESGELVWALGGLAVRTYDDAEIHLDGWHTAPQPGRTFAWLRDPRAEAATDWDGGDL